MGDGLQRTAHPSYMRPLNTQTIRHTTHRPKPAMGLLPQAGPQQQFVAPALKQACPAGAPEGDRMAAHYSATWDGSKVHAGAGMLISPHGSAIMLAIHPRGSKVQAGPACCSCQRAGQSMSSSILRFYPCHARISAQGCSRHSQAAASAAGRATAAPRWPSAPPASRGTACPPAQVQAQTCPCSAHRHAIVTGSHQRIRPGTVSSIKEASNRQGSNQHHAFVLLGCPQSPTHAQPRASWQTECKPQQSSSPVEPPICSKPTAHGSLVTQGVALIRQHAARAPARRTPR